MATPVLHFAVFQLFLLWTFQIVEVVNSTTFSGNTTRPTTSNGVSNHLMSTNNLDSNPDQGATNGTNMRQIRGTPVGKSKNQGATQMLVSSIISTEKPVGSTTGSGGGGSSTTESSDKKEYQDHLPFWAYIVIVIGVILLVAVGAVFYYTRMIRTKNHGSYTVWDDNELLDLSPAFTRESEFLLDNLVADQEQRSPELQTYEIPLDYSLGIQRAYIGTKKVAPKADEGREVVKYSKPKKPRRKAKHDSAGNTVPMTGRTDHIYSSVNDEVTNTLSEGDLCEERNVNSHTLPKVSSPTGNMQELDASKLGVNGSLSPKDFLRELNNSSRTKSVSNLLQNRPLPPAPSKRFSKSLDRFRFFEAVSSRSKIKSKTTPCRVKSNPLRPHRVLVKSSSFGGTFNKIIKPVLSPVRKGSLDLLDQSVTFDTRHVRKSNLCHRHSKSLDTLLLLKDLNWTAYDIDIYHSYASVCDSLGDNHEGEPPYASVDSPIEKASCLWEISGRVPSPSKSSPRSESDGPVDELSGENLYASVSDDELSIIEGDSRCTNSGTGILDSGMASSIAGSEDPMSPYASVRISQIPDLAMTSLEEEIQRSEEGFEKEDSGSTIGSCKDLEENEDMKRVSVHSYLELLSNSRRDSVISETSSGYARPTDVISEKLEQEDPYCTIEYPREQSQSEQDDHSNNNEDCVPLVSDNSADVEEEGRREFANSGVQSKGRLSDLINEAAEVGEDLDRCDMADRHVYENTDFVEDLQSRGTPEHFRKTAEGVPVV